jgi:hypothetical protein
VDFRRSLGRASSWQRLSRGGSPLDCGPFTGGKEPRKSCAPCEPGKIACCRSGQSAPTTERPSTMPATSWPMTAGWPIRCMASPSSRPTTSRWRICTKKIGSEGPDGAPSAAKASDAANSASTAATHPGTWVHDSSQGVIPCRSNATKKANSPKHNRHVEDPITAGGAREAQ